MKLKYFISNEKGMALMTTLMLGLISIGMIGGVYFAMTNSARTKGVSERYTQELEIARGIADYIRAGIFQEKVNEDGGIKCRTTGSDANATCDINTRIIRIPFDAAIGKTNLTDVNATFLSFSDDIYSIRVISRNTTTNEHAEIDFVMSF